MKTKEVNEIIKDLYNIDPTLKEYEDKIRDIVLEIYYEKPEVEINDIFKDELRKKILNRIDEIKIESRQNNKVIQTDNKYKLITIMKKINYILAGSVVTVCLFGAFIYMLNANGTISFNGGSEKNSISNGLKTVDFDLAIKNSNRSFGNLFSQNSTNTVAREEGLVSARASASPAGLGIGGGGGVVAPMMAGDSVAKSMIAPYNPTIYKYVYKGDKTFLDNFKDSDFPVLKRIKNATVVFNDSNIFSANSLDMSKFSNLKINNISIDEDKEYGYSLYMALTEGSLSISKNWATWPQIDYNTKYEDMLLNDELIKIANNFAEKYNINLQNYSSPEIQTDYRVMYERAADKNNFYIPTSSTVIYPLLIDGKEVYEQYGEKYGIMMSIGFKEKKVEYVNNIQTLKFESSSYELNKDVDTIIKIAENTDNYYYYSDTDDVKKVEIELKDPKIVYAKIFTYDSTTNTGSEFLVPAVAFKTSGDYDPNTYNREYVLIPLAKDYIDQELDRISEMEKLPKPNEIPMDIPVSSPENPDLIRIQPLKTE